MVDRGLAHESGPVPAPPPSPRRKPAPGARRPEEQTIARAGHRVLPSAPKSAGPRMRAATPPGGRPRPLKVPALEAARHAYSARRETGGGRCGSLRFACSRTPSRTQIGDEARGHALRTPRTASSRGRPGSASRRRYDPPPHAVGRADEVPVSVSLRRDVRVVKRRGEEIVAGGTRPSTGVKPPPPRSVASAPRTTSYPRSRRPRRSAQSVGAREGEPARAAGAGNGAPMQGPTGKRRPTCRRSRRGSRACRR